MTKDYVNILLMGLLGNPELIEKWWTSPNKGFDNKCPKDVSIDKVAEYLEGFCFG